ncbi:MAG: hypothetical protein ACP5PX_01025 [Candidatus Hadarchaeum sp.]|uniref:hypothetical protein n=1 Tax=Candidatus Hadarchaeum sp. TaxID=2883567 RepID=UPI003D0B3A1E
MKEEKIEKNKPQLAALVVEINKIRTPLSLSLKDLYQSEPEDEVHHGLVKSATEARKLFYEKISRAIANMECPQEFTADSLLKFNEKISKATSIIADAMKAHGRYVRAVFGKKYAEFEFHLRKLNELIIQTQPTLNHIIVEINALDGLISEISSYKLTQMEMERIKGNIAHLQDKVKKLEIEINEIASQIARIKVSPEFKRATDLAGELERTRHEISKARESTVCLISELNRPFRKLEKSLKAGELQTVPELEKILEICINEPGELISSEDNLNAFDKLLRRTLELAGCGKIGLDKREMKNLEAAAHSLPSRLKEVKKNLAMLMENAENMKRDSENPLFEEVVKLENLIEKLEEERKESLHAIEQLESKIRDMLEELVSKKNVLQKSAGELLGTKIEITS